MIITKQVKIEKTNELLTPAAGIIPMLHFLKKIQFSQTIRQHVEHPRGRSAVYSFTDAVESIVIGAARGVKSMLQIGRVWMDPVLSVLSGVGCQHPHNCTLGRIIAESTQKDDVGMREANIAIGNSIRKDNGTKILPVDGDSTVQTVYGHQEGATIGYNPHKKGAPSYHPLLLFHQETKEILLGKLRPGDAYTANGALESLKELAAQFPEKIIKGRFDSGFFDGKIMDWADDHGHMYLIKVKLKGLKDILRQSVWVTVPEQPDCSVALFWYRADGWDYQRLLQAVRIKKDCGEKVTSSETEDEEYAYFCYACNYELNPWAVHKEYGQRATSENWIQEAKTQIGICSVRTQKFWANAVIFQAMVLTYNIMRWMAFLSGDLVLNSWEINTIRQNLIGMAGKLVTRGRQWILKVPRSMLHPLQWDSWAAVGGL